MTHARKAQTGLPSKKRKSYSPQFKLKLALEAIKKNTLSELSRKYNIRTNVLSEWRKMLLEQGSSIFETSPDKENAKLKNKIANLEQMLGKKEVEMNLLKNFSDFYQSQSGT